VEIRDLVGERAIEDLGIGGAFGKAKEIESPKNDERAEEDG